jgi:hypothetical protein
VTSVAGRNGDVLLALADIADASANGRSLVAAANYAAMKVLLALDLVSNTSDANKPVSTAQQVALNLKANLVSPPLSGAPTTPNVSASDASTKIANTAYVDAAVAVIAGILSGALVFKGAWDASAGTFPGAGAAQLGWFYKISVPGTVNGIPFAVGDDVYAVVNNASTSTYAANWLKVQGAITLAEIQAIVGITANGLSLITAANYAAMRTLLGLGTAAPLNVGTALNDVVQLDGSAKLPAVDGSQLTNLTTGRVIGDVFASFDASPAAGCVEFDGSTITGGVATYPIVAARYSWMQSGADLKLPDLRGKFLRGWAHGSSNDPDRASRTARVGDSQTGDYPGTNQADGFRSHLHASHYDNNTLGSGGGSFGTFGSSNTANSDNTGGNETRPININVMYCMKMG